MKSIVVTKILLMKLIEIFSKYIIWLYFFWFA